MTPPLTPDALTPEALAGDDDSEKLEVELLLSGIQKRYGYDFSHYSHASLMRRLRLAREQAKLTRFTEMLDQLLHDERRFDDFLRHMSINVTELFRDPLFYKAVREKIVPLLKTYPFVKIWHAGCATGEEPYSMAMLLHEEGFLSRVRLYATDFNKHALATAAAGIYPAKHLELYAANYAQAGGVSGLSNYCESGYELLKFKDFLKERITFSYHNLVTDGVFGEMNLILCRNVLIYFDKVLQNRVLCKFADSLGYGGVLCLGTKESLKFSAVAGAFEAVDEKQRIYRKTGGRYGL